MNINNTQTDVQEAIKMACSVPLDDLPSWGVICFIDTSNKGVYVISSKSLLTEYPRMLQLMRNGDHPCKALNEAYRNNTLSFKLLHSFSHLPLSRESRVQYNIELNKLLQDGYINLREGYVSIRYKLRIKVLQSFKDELRPLVYVYAESTRRDTLVLGIFPTLYDAEDWAKSTFPSFDDITPVFHENDLLKEFREAHGEELKLNKFIVYKNELFSDRNSGHINTSEIELRVSDIEYDE